MLKRIITLICGILIFVIVFFLDSLNLVSGPIFFNIAFTICAALMCHEFYKSMESINLKPIKLIGYLCCALIIPLGVVSTDVMTIICASFIPLIVFLGLGTSVFTNIKYNIVDVAVTIFGAIYTVMLSAFVANTRALPGGEYLVWYVFWAPWACDIFAYLIGRAIGKHKFTEISPKKSIEGCIAGIVGTIVFVLGYSFALSKLLDVESFSNYDKINSLFFTNIPLQIAIGVLVSVISQIGDLAASSIKRYTKLKDFGTIMPGHGGVLDRFDSILFTAPIIYYTFYIILKCF